MYTYMCILYIVYVYICIYYTYTHTHTHTYIYIYIYIVHPALLVTFSGRVIRGIYSTIFLVFKEFT